MTIVKWTTSWSITLELSIMLLESSIMHPEQSIMLLEPSFLLLENIYTTGFTHDNHNMFIAQATARDKLPSY